MDLGLTNLLLSYQLQNVLTQFNEKSQLCPELTYNESLQLYLQSNIDSLRTKNCDVVKELEMKMSVISLIREFVKFFSASNPSLDSTFIYKYLVKLSSQIDDNQQLADFIGRIKELITEFVSKNDSFVETYKLDDNSDEGDENIYESFQMEAIESFYKDVKEALSVIFGDNDFSLLQNISKKIISSDCAFVELESKMVQYFSAFDENAKTENVVKADKSESFIPSDEIKPTTPMETSLLATPPATNTPSSSTNDENSFEATFEDTGTEAAFNNSEIGQEEEEENDEDEEEEDSDAEVDDLEHKMIEYFSSFENDENDENEKQIKKAEINEIFESDDRDRSEYRYWTDAECEHLYAGFMLYGKNWSLVSEHFHEALSKRDSKALSNKYVQLREKGKLDIYKAKAKEIYRKNKVVLSENEICHLLAGVKLFGTKWTCIATHFQEVFANFSPSHLNYFYSNMSKKSTSLVKYAFKVNAILKKIHSKPEIIKAKYSKWTETEITYLLAGYEICGKGNWIKIVDMFNNKLNSRNENDVRKKYYQLLKTNQVEHYETAVKKIISKWRK